MKGVRWLIFLLVPLIMVHLPGCSRDDDEVIVLETEPEPPPGEIQNANLVELHEHSGEIPDSYCITCHGDMTDDFTLDPDVVGIHTLHKDEINYACTTCHVSTDLIHGSGALLLKQVSSEAVCDKCHGPDGVGKQLFQK